MYVVVIYMRISLEARIVLFTDALLVILASQDH